MHGIDDRHDFNDDTWLDRRFFAHERELAKRGYAEPFNVHWRKTEIFKGTMTIREGKLEKIVFTWRDDPVADD